MNDVTALLGRETTLLRCRAGLAGGGAVLLTGPGGIGKSAVLDTLAAEASLSGTLVLRSGSSALEAGLPHLALYDLFAGPLAEQDARAEGPRDGLIAPHLRAALDVALLRAPAGDGPPGRPTGPHPDSRADSHPDSRPDPHLGRHTDRAVDQLAVRVAVLELLQALAAQRPVLLVLDDAHCLDAQSAQVLAFAARRLAGHRVQVLAAERLADGGEPHCLALLPGPATELPLNPLPAAVIDELLRTRGCLTPSDPVTERIALASGGNPGYALDLSRAVRRSPGPIRADDPLPVPRGLRTPLAGRLAALPRATLDALLQLGAAHQPHPAQAAPPAFGLAVPPILGPAAPPALGLVEPAAPAHHRPAGEAPAPAAAGADRQVLAPAFAVGLLVQGPGGEPRFAHPLLRELVYADATPEERRQCHHRLAQRANDPLERARHRALACPEPDPGLAAELAAAARIAVDRGAPALAAELSRLAAERTADEPELAAERLLTAARHAHDAGQAEAAEQACATVLRTANRAARVGARLLLVQLAGGDRSAVPALLDAAQADAGEDPRLRAAVQLHRAEHALSTGRCDLGLAELAEAERHVRHSGDPEQQIEVIALRTPIEMQLRPDRVLPSLRQAAALAAGRPAAALTAASIQVRCCRVVWLLRAGSVPEALAEVDELRREVEGAGRVKDLADVLHLVASVNERAGRCAQAYQAGRYGGRLRRELGPTPAPGLVLSAAAELNGGTGERATELAAAAVRAAEAAGDMEWAAYALGLLGRADLLGGRFPQAAEHLGRCRSLLRGLGYTDPALFLVDADLVEALCASGAVAPAWRALEEAAAQAARLDRQVLRLGLARARALLTARDGDPRGAADELRAELPRSHPYPLERARALLTLGDLERRARRRAAARADLRAAAEVFATARCLPWLAHAQERLARLDGADGPAPALSDLEGRIVELVRGGATNRQIAATLHVSVKSVEGSLTRLYRRFGVRDRTELTARRLVS
ncbi:AAA family ATPase [Kitasatospora sp. NPDC008050]|uniref:AAA family ATPase n=1 Tax=Kitasatospora sp. NPDC008050 TaxID=3364021 RepID=UPI0036E1C234